jgi:hypothetical protein
MFADRLLEVTDRQALLVDKIACSPEQPVVEVRAPWL